MFPTDARGAAITPVISPGSDPNAVNPSPKRKTTNGKIVTQDAGIADNASLTIGGFQFNLSEEQKAAWQNPGY